MRLWLSVLGCFLVFLFPSNFVAADPPLPENAAIPWTPPSMPAVQALPTAPIEPPRAVGPQWLDTEVLLGLPTEVRVQWSALRGTNIAFMIEGIGGVEVIPFVFGAIGAGILGGGGRLRVAACNGERNAFVIKPGVDVYGWFSGMGVARASGGADVELLWHHNPGPCNRCGFQMGVDLGAFFGTGGSSWWAWPMVSGIFGLHF